MTERLLGKESVALESDSYRKLVKTEGYFVKISPCPARMTSPLSRCAISESFCFVLNREGNPPFRIEYNTTRWTWILIKRLKLQTMNGGLPSYYFCNLLHRETRTCYTISLSIRSIDYRINQNGSAVSRLGGGKAVAFTWFNFHSNHSNFCQFQSNDGSTGLSFNTCCCCTDAKVHPQPFITKFYRQVRATSNTYVKIFTLKTWQLPSPRNYV